MALGTFQVFQQSTFPQQLPVISGQNGCVKRTRPLERALLAPPSTCNRGFGVQAITSATTRIRAIPRSSNCKGFIAELYMGRRLGATQRQNQQKEADQAWPASRFTGAGNGIRTRDLQLGKLTLYH